METIKSYLDNMFANMPKTPALIKLKEDLLSSMEDKYNEMKYHGKSENEAIGIVISEFGNIDELIRELNIEVPSSMQPVLPVIKKEETERIIHDKKFFGNLIALGVFLCITAPAVFVLGTSVMSIQMGEDSAATLFLFPLFLMIAVAVGLFIFSGIQLDQYKYLERPFVLDYSLTEVIRKKKTSYLPYFTLKIVAGVVLCILSPLTLISLTVFVRDNDFYGAVGVFLLLIMVACAVTLFINAGTTMDCYRQLLQEGDYAPERKEDKLVGAVASVVWPLTTAGYLLWSFLTGDWHITWIVWPIMGILFGAFSAVVSIIRGDKQ
ncbi:MAG: permease prefix domain 1-containing protein [Lachnospiraceae bacterium]|nr:permease prefix domain 1-containing protein [Lachnospiraceae bacterium]MDD3659827.1 permease prefix domain 1-containing protein [Lachnospiraceae bacterium]